MDSFIVYMQILYHNDNFLLLSLSLFVWVSKALSLSLFIFNLPYTVVNRIIILMSELFHYIMSQSSVSLSGNLFTPLRILSEQ
jgi:hypothetical protein